MVTTADRALTRFRQDALLDIDQEQQIRTRIANLISFGVNYWRPLHMRQDYWASMYLLLDQIQQSKPLGYRRFVSNEPRTAVDTAVSIMTRNESYWRSDLNEAEGENKDQRALIGKIERMMQGLILDIDEMFSMRGESPLWKQVAWHALMRGWIWGKFHITTSALDYRESPVIAEVYDSRLVLPHFDNFGLESVIIRQPTTVGAITSIYENVFTEISRSKNFDPNRPAEKIEFWSNQRGERPGITGTLAVLPGQQEAGNMGYLPFTPHTSANLAGSQWLVLPYRHGYSPQALPVIGVPVNGIPIKYKPYLPDPVTSQYNQRANLFGVETRFWQGPNTSVAESGRSLLASVEEEVPQFNEMVATIMQHTALETYSPIFVHTATGELPEIPIGINARIPLRPEERVERMQLQPMNQDAYRLLDILRQEQQQGTLSAILRAVLPAGGGDVSSGILFQQLTSAALNALEPFLSGLVQFGQRMGTSIIMQLQVSAREIRPFTVAVPFKQNSFFSLEFDPKTDLQAGRKYKIRPIFRPALPDDMAIRIQMARLALDPRRPILSLVTVLEKFMGGIVEDPEQEADRIWEDLANQDPVIVLEQIAQALERHGEQEMADRIRESEMRHKLIEDLQFRQATGTVPGPQGGGGLNMGPESGVPGSTQRGGGGGGGGSSPDIQQGRALVAAMGSQAGV